MWETLACKWVVRGAWGEARTRMSALLLGLTSHPVGFSFLPVLILRQREQIGTQLSVLSFMTLGMLVHFLVCGYLKIRSTGPSPFPTDTDFFFVRVCVCGVRKPISIWCMLEIEIFWFCCLSYSCRESPKYFILCDQSRVTFFLLCSAATWICFDALNARI